MFDFCFSRKKASYLRLGNHALLTGESAVLRTRSGAQQVLKKKVVE